MVIIRWKYADTVFAPLIAEIPQTYLAEKRFLLGSKWISVESVLSHISDIRGAGAVVTWKVIFESVRPEPLP